MKISLIDYGAKRNGRLPCRKHPMDAGADVFAPGYYLLSPGETVKIPLGFGLNIPDGFMASIYIRGSMAKAGITCSLNPVDAGYTGEIHAVITNIGRGHYEIIENDRIGQLVILPCVIAEFVSSRGDNGFGSTGR